SARELISHRCVVASRRPSFATIASLTRVRAFTRRPIHGRLPTIYPHLPRVGRWLGSVSIVDSYKPDTGAIAGISVPARPLRNLHWRPRGRPHTASMQ